MLVSSVRYKLYSGIGIWLFVSGAAVLDWLSRGTLNACRRLPLSNFELKKTVSSVI